MKNKKIQVLDWGLIDYKEAWDKQEAIFADTVKLKIALREKQTAGESKCILAKNSNLK